MGVESPEMVVVAGAMVIPASDDGATSLSPLTIPPWLRQKLSEAKTSLPTVEEIEAKLRGADLRRQDHMQKRNSPQEKSNDTDTSALCQTSSMHVIPPFTIFFGGIIHPFTAANIRGSGGGFDPDIAHPLYSSMEGSSIHPLQLSSEDISL
nr:uncharacterized protein LOC109167189 [Ipomoea trifida]